MADRTVLFVCLHGAAKSVIAAACFDRLAREQGLEARADFAGVEPDPEIAPVVVRELRAEGVDLGARRPTPLTPARAAAAWRVVSLGCDLRDLAPAGVAVERWDEVPAVSDGYRAAREAIEARVARMLARG